MGFRVVDRSTFAFETDLPAASRNIHPSGVLHAFRTTSSNERTRSEHAFAWIEDSLHTDAALDHLEQHGFDREEGAVFIPYSTKRNWLDAYPHAEPALECSREGKVTVFLNWRPYPNGLGELGNDPGTGTGTGAAAKKGEEEDAGGKSKKRKYKSRYPNLLQDNTLLPDPERDELHVEIYNYFAWLHGRLAELEGRAAADGDDAPTAAAKRGEAAAKIKKDKGIDTPEIRCVMERMEKAFAIIPNLRREMEQMDVELGKGEPTPPVKEGTDSEGEGQPTGDRKPSSVPQLPPMTKGAPFLEEALGGALTRLVEARGTNEKGRPVRRSRKKLRTPSGNPNRRHDRTPADFDEMFQRLVRYKEAHGDTLVSKNDKEDQKLANWVRGMREKKRQLLRKGIEVEEVPPGGKLLAKTLTAERQEKLDSIGFVWSIAGPKVAWETRFEELMAYKEEHGKWPSQSMGTLGEWIHKQRGFYQRKDQNYMKTRAPLLDAVGFEWTPRGNTRMNWDEGLGLLLEFGKTHGHFDVPRPEWKKGDLKSNEIRLFNWVESLHGMYRQYKLGRKSGSLTDERVLLLVKHGFVFRNDEYAQTAGSDSISSEV